MNFTKIEQKHIIDTGNENLCKVIEEFGALEKKGTSFIGKCPSCGRPQGLTVTPSKHIFKCFHCNECSGKGAVAYLMAGQNKTYPEALEYIARMFNIVTDEDIKKAQLAEAKRIAEKSSAAESVPGDKPKKGSKKQKGQDPETFCSRMLHDSGLTPADVTASVTKIGDTKSIFELKTFHSGTMDAKGEITTSGDDAVIEYYDLDGFPVTYEAVDMKGRPTGKMREYCRIRWQFPSEHLDKSGKPYKYKSPRGSGTPIYIPERLRAAYRKKEEITRLFIQEGEKKAEKCCKHGIMSIAVSGIQNLGLKGAFPEDLIRIIKDCKTKEVVFMFDSDWNDISENIRITDQIDKRPRNFFYAARNYKEYMRSLVNRNLWVEIFIGNVNKNEKNDKGIDDLLANTLAKREDDLLADIEHTIHEKEMVGEYVTLHKITTWTDHKLEELWSLNSPAKFAETHKDILINLPEFRIGRHIWRFNENGTFVSAQPIESDEQFWDEVQKSRRDGTSYTEYEFKYVRSRRFLQGRGFGRFRCLDGKTWFFIHLQPPFVKQIVSSDARDYIFEFCTAYCNEDVNEMISKGVSQYVGPDKLSLLNFIEPNFLKPNRSEQFLYFDKNCWKITENSVLDMGYEQVSQHVWIDQMRRFPAKYVGAPLIKFTEKDGKYDFRMSEAGKNCQFLRFLENASNFTWRKEKAIAKGEPAEILPEEILENKQHLLSKLCAIGYMLMGYKDPNVVRAVIGMDGKQSEVGESNGRSGKSLIGELMRQVLPIAYIDGKRKDMFSDAFLWNDVNEKTRLVFIDDVMQNFQFEPLFACMTGDWSVNYKGGTRITFPFASSPKIYIATNHAIKGSGDSFGSRQWLLAFSDFYNATHHPQDDFGCLFFSEWDFEQWNLCWNMMANCVQLYMQFGVIQAPGERLEQRKLRQEIGEIFISWADEYFSDPNHLNVRIPRNALKEVFYEYDRPQTKFISSTEFKKRLIKYCEWAGYVYNPHMYDSISNLPKKLDKDGRPVIDDKSGGIESFVIGDKNFKNGGLQMDEALPESPNLDF